MFNGNPYGGFYAQPGAAMPWQRPMPCAPMQGGQPQTPVYNGEIINVNGEAGARSLRLAPNSSVILRDANSPIVWLCEADGTGYFEPIPYTVSPYQARPQADMSDYERRLARLEAMLIYEQSDDEPAGETPRRRRIQRESADE